MAIVRHLEGDIILSWEYSPSKHRKTIYSLICIIVIGGGIAWLMKFGKLVSSICIWIVWGILAFLMRGFRSQKYALTTRGAYVFNPGHNEWKRLGYWSEFTDYERGEYYIKLIKKRWLGKYIYFNRNSPDYLQIISIVNENIFKKII